MISKAKTNYDFSGSEMLDCDVCSNFSNVTGQPTYTETPEDYDLLIEEYKKSESKKSFNDWLSSDSSKAKYIKSGSEKPFKEWLEKDSSKNILAAIGTLGAAFLAGKNQDKKDVLDSENKKEEKKTNWILVSSLVLGGVALTIGGYFLVKKIMK